LMLTSKHLRMTSTMGLKESKLYLAKINYQVLWWNSALVTQMMKKLNQWASLPTSPLYRIKKNNLWLNQRRKAHRSNHWYHYSPCTQGDMDSERINIGKTDCSSEAKTLKRKVSMKYFHISKSLSIQASVIDQENTLQDGLLTGKEASNLFCKKLRM
jgi:hypothetical protein